MPKHLSIEQQIAAKFQEDLYNGVFDLDDSVFLPAPEMQAEQIFENIKQTKKEYDEAVSKEITLREEYPWLF